MSCRVCGKPAVDRLVPFCSRRCADVDLARWLRGDYAIPGPAIEPLENAIEDETDPSGTPRLH